MPHTPQFLQRGPAPSRAPVGTVDDEFDED
jgi:hypothetical protein